MTTPQRSLPDASPVWPPQAISPEPSGVPCSRAVGRGQVWPELGGRRVSFERSPAPRAVSAGEEGWVAGGLVSLQDLLCGVKSAGLIQIQVRLGKAANDLWGFSIFIVNVINHFCSLREEQAVH